MPTPRPISAARIGAKSTMVTAWLSGAIIISPLPTPASAVTIGSAIANSEPNATNKITAAAATPIIDALDSGCCSLFSMAWPPSCTVSPCALAASAMLITRLTSVLFRLPACWVKSTVANAVRRAVGRLRDTVGGCRLSGRPPRAR